MDHKTNTINKTINYFEDNSTPLINYFISFACILTLRNFLEGFSHYGFINLFYVNAPESFLFSEFFHFFLFYTCIAFLLILVLHFLTKESTKIITKIVLPAFILTLIVPVIDLFISKGTGQHIAYLFPNENHSLIYYYLTFFKSVKHISWGIRLEILAALSCGACYLWYKTKKIPVVILGLISIYTIIFLVGSTPYIMTATANLLHINIPIVSKNIVNYFLLLLFPLGIAISFFANKKIFLSLFQDLRIPRLLHFELMLYLGVAFAIKQLNIFNAIDLIFLSISILFFWLSAIMLNNIYDQDIDRISNPNRPLITKEIGLLIYQNITTITLCCSLIYALAVNTMSFLIIGCAALASYFYSTPPLRLKKNTHPF